MSEQTHFASLVIQCRSDQAQTLRQTLHRPPTLEVTHWSAAGKLVVVLECTDAGKISDFLNGVSLYPGVLSANLIYHHVEDTDQLDELVQINHPLDERVLP